MSINIAAGLSLPFFPMRPKMGVRLTSVEQALKEISALHHLYVFQPKMNGDRVLLATSPAPTIVKGSIISAYQRYGKPYTFSFDKTPWRALPDLTCLDGEVKDGEFHPFELLALAGESWLRKSVEERIEGAKDMCTKCGVTYKFDFKAFTDSELSPLEEFITRHLTPSKLPRNTSPYWEGLVAKKKGSKYNILGSIQDDPLWTKLKWSYAQ